jgi:hypothetical protein
MPLLERLDDNLAGFIDKQRVFFVATAPRAGRVNVSPKGLDTFRRLDHQTVLYLDLTGSGNETAAHIEDNGRLTIMFCSFSENPLILRLYGRGEVIHRRDARWDGLYALFEPHPSARQMIRLRIEAVQTSCGHGVPRCEVVSERPTLTERAHALGEEAIRRNWRTKNQTSIDGLPTGLLSDADPGRPPA